MSNYLIKPKSIRKSDIINKIHSLHPTEHKKIVIANKNLKSIGSLINEEGVGEQINVDEYLNFPSKYTLVTISNMRKCIIDTNQGENISPSIFENSTKKLVKGDILISRNASLGKITLIHKDFNGILNGGISYLRLNDNLKYYLFAFFIMDYGTEYLTVLTSGGGTQKNAKRQNLLDVKLPFPTIKNNKNPELVEKYISLLAENLVDKEIEIENKQIKIDKIIRNELKYEDQSSFKFSYPTKKTLLKETRLDTGLYNMKFKSIENSILNYKGGYSNLFDLGFSISRGQNLQLSAIGLSYYSKVKFNNGFTRLILSSQISNDSVIIGEKYIGNRNKLKTISEGEIIFCSRGAQFGRITILPETIENTITNIDNLHISNNSIELNKKISFTLIINHLRKIGFLRKIAIFGNGSFSFTKYQFQRLNLPVFDKKLEMEISKLYYFKTEKTEFNIDNYFENEKERNKKIGIYQLNMEIIEIKELLKILIEKLLNEKPIKINGKANA